MFPETEYLKLGKNGVLGSSTIQLKQYDKNTAIFNITLHDELGNINVIPPGYVAKFQATKQANGHIIFDDCEPIVNNTITYKPDEQLTTTPGLVECAIGLYSPDPTGNTTKDELKETASFLVNIKPSAMDRKGVQSSNEFNTLTIMINTITGLVETTTETLEQIGQAITNAESAVQSANELSQQVQSAENIRNTNENNRIVAENSRVQAETNRNNAEFSRVTAENNRVSQEAIRISNEQSRISTESGRNTAESTRATAESNRISAENTRLISEQSREDAESSRVTAENIRKQNEINRQEAIEGLESITQAANEAKEDAIQAANEANEATANANDASVNADIAADRANQAAQAAEDIVAGTGIVMQTEKGAPGGVATLDASAKIPEVQLPNDIVRVESVSEPQALGDTKQLKDNQGNNIAPVTKTSAVYDNNGVDLDSKLNTYCRLHGGIAIQEGEDLNDPKFLEIGNYYCESNDLVNTLLNLPPTMEKRAFKMHVYSGTGNGYPVQHIETYDWGRMYRRMFEPYNGTYTWWVKYLDANDMINSDTINDSGKVPSSAVTYALGQEVDSVKGFLLDLFSNQYAGLPDFTQHPADFLEDNRTFNFRCVESKNAEYKPIPNEAHVWFNVLTFGISTRCTQLAFCGYIGWGESQKIYMRTQHDNNVTSWREI